MLRSTGVCDLSDGTDTERYCNAVAAAVLMPAWLVGREAPDDHAWGKDVEEDEKVMTALARKFGVSQASMLIRLRDLAVISQPLYERLEYRRSLRRPAKRKGDPTFYRVALSRVGRRYARHVFGVYDAGVIDRQDASALLEVGEHHVEGFRRELLEGGGSA